jgi:hypothetical protein
MQVNNEAGNSLLASADAIVFGATIDADLGISNRTRRDWIAKGILPKPDGNLLGRSFWRLATYQGFKREVTAGRFARANRLPHMRDNKSAA